MKDNTTFEAGDKVIFNLHPESNLGPDWRDGCIRAIDGSGRIWVDYDHEGVEYYKSTSSKNVVHVLTDDVIDQMVSL